MIELGVIATCRITGITGVVVSRHQYLTGCDRYAIQPKVDKDGKLPEAHFADEGMIDVDDDITPVKPIKEMRDFSNPDVRGGPQPTPPARGI